MKALARLWVCELVVWHFVAHRIDKNVNVVHDLCGPIILILKIKWKSTLIIMGDSDYDFIFSDLKSLWYRTRIEKDDQLYDEVIKWILYIQKCSPGFY